MFNCKIIELDPVVRYTKRGWYIYDISFTVGPFGGSCSLIDCGVEKSLTPEELERRFREFYLYYETEPEYAAKLGLMTSKDKIWKRLKSGEPICDNLGRCLPEIYDKRSEAQARDFYEEP